jgi:large subunit ribosomal protein L6
MRVKDYNEELELPEGVNAQLNEALLTVTKDKASVERSFRHPKITLRLEGNKVRFVIPIMTKREKTALGTFKAHVRNMAQGVQEPFVYKLKVCSGHFPMNISMNNGGIVVKNFIGEKVPRVLKIREGVDVKIDGDVITVSCPDKELAGLTAGSIEKLCSRPGFDKRIFQQGIYITEKAGKQI